MATQDLCAGALLSASIAKRLSYMEQSEFDKVILSYSGREFHRNILISVARNRPAPDNFKHLPFLVPV